MQQSSTGKKQQPYVHKRQCMELNASKTTSYVFEQMQSIILNEKHRIYLPTSPKNNWKNTHRNNSLTPDKRKKQPIFHNSLQKSLINTLFTSFYSSKKNLDLSIPQIYQLSSSYFLISFEKKIYLYSVCPKNQLQHELQLDIGRSKHMTNDTHLIFHYCYEVWQEVSNIHYLRTNFNKENSDINALIQYKQSSNLTFVKLALKKGEIQFLHKLHFSGQIVYTSYFYTEYDFVIACCSQKPNKAGQYIISLYNYFWKDNKVTQFCKLQLYRFKDVNDVVEMKGMGIATSCLCNYYLQKPIHCTLFFSVLDKEKLEIHLRGLQFIKHPKPTTNNTFLAKKKGIYHILQMQTLDNLFSSLKVWFKDGYFFFDVILDQVLIIKKKFNHYHVMNSIRISQSRGSRLFIYPFSNIICKIEEQNLQLFKIIFDEMSCKYQLLDYILISNKNFYKQVTSICFFQNKQQILIGAFILGHQSTLYFYGSYTIPMIQKIRQIVKCKSYQDLQAVQQISQKLGINKKQFYLDVWNQSNRTSRDIQLLTQCQDPKTIWRQLIQYLKHNKLSIKQLSKCYKKVQEIIYNKLKINFTVDLLKDYLRVSFMKQKLILYDVDLKLGFLEFQQIFKLSIFELLWETIDKILFPHIKPKCIFGYQRPAERPKVILSHVLQQFKLLILQDYEYFLKKLLSKYPRHFSTIISIFPYLLPRHPFNIRIFSGEEIYYTDQNGIYYGNQKNTDDKSAIITTVDDRIQQQSWFSDIRRFQWMTFKSTKDFILNVFSQDHSTNHILTVLAELQQSHWFQKNKFVTHGFIMSTKKQYERILAKYNSRSIYLMICQYANQMQALALQQQLTDVEREHLQYQQQDWSSLSRNRAQSQASVSRKNRNSKIQSKTHRSNLNDSIHNISDINVNASKVHIGTCSNFNLSKHQIKTMVLNDLKQRTIQNKSELASHGILQALKKDNFLPDQLVQQYCLYSAIHKFFQKQQMIEKQTTIEDILLMKDQALISLFFLGNKQKKQLILFDFRNLFDDIGLFNNKIAKFADSDESSTIQLDLLIVQIIGIQDQDQYDTYQFQKQNQNLIQILIMGYCKKLEIQQDKQIGAFLELASQVLLNKPLLIAINKVNELRKCEGIFFNFKMDHITLDQIIDKPSKIMQTLMQRFFQNKMISKFQITKGAEKNITFDLSNIRVMYNLLLYLHQTIFYQMNEFEILMIFCDMCLIYHNFQAVSDILEENQIIQMLGGAVQLELFTHQLISKSLFRIYNEKNKYFDRDTIDYVKSILNLSSVTTYTIKQNAKLQIVAILLSWNIPIRPSYLQQICTQWQRGQRSNFLHKQIIQRQISQLKYDDFAGLYQFLQIATIGDINVSLQNEQFFYYCKILAEELMINNRYDEASSILGRIRIADVIIPPYGLEVKCFFFSLMLNYKQTLATLEFYRCYIQHFVLNYQDHDIIESLFNNFLHESEIQGRGYHIIELDPILQLQSELFQNDNPIEISLNQLWQIAKNLSDRQKLLDFSQLKKINQSEISSTGHRFMNRSSSDILSSKQLQIKTKKDQSNLSIFVQQEKKQKGQLQMSYALNIFETILSTTQSKQESPKRINKDAPDSILIPEPIECNHILTSYYFLLIILKYPKYGFSNLLCIPFNFDFLFQILVGFQKLVFNNEEYWQIDVEKIFRLYRRGLYMMLLDEVDPNNQIEIKDLSEAFFETIRQKVREVLPESKNNKKIKSMFYHLNRVNNIMQRIVNHRKEITYKLKTRKKQKEKEQQQLYKYEIQQKQNRQRMEQEQLNRQSTNNIQQGISTYQELRKVKSTHIGHSFIKSQKNLLQTTIQQLQEKKKSPYMPSPALSDIPGYQNRQQFNQFQYAHNNFLQAVQQQGQEQDQQFVPEFGQNRQSLLQSFSPLRKQIITGEQILKCIQNNELDKIRQIKNKDFEQQFTKIYKDPQIHFGILLNILCKFSGYNQDKIDIFVDVENRQYVQFKDILFRLFNFSFFRTNQAIIIQRWRQSQLNRILPLLKEDLIRMDINQINRLIEMLQKIYQLPQLQNYIYANTIFFLQQDQQTQTQFSEKINELIQSINLQFVMSKFDELMSTKDDQGREKYYKILTRKLGDFDS